MLARGETRSSGVCWVIALLALGCGWLPDPSVVGAQENGKMTEEEAIRLGEEFGLIVDKVDEGILEELRWEGQGVGGVVILGVIGSSRAEESGMEARKVILQIDGAPIGNLIDFGRAIKRTMGACGFSVVTYEPATPDNQGIGAGVNTNSVLCPKD